MTDLVECPDAVVAVQDEDSSLTGAAARTARKQRLEEREQARLQRMSQRVAVRRVVDARQGQRRHAEEERLQRVAQKAAARRAARAAAGAEGDGATEGAREEPAAPGGRAEDSSSSSSSPSSPSATAMAIAKALATGAPVPNSAPSKTPCFAWERSLQPANAGGVPTPQSAIFTGTPVVVPLASSTELEQFLQAGGVDGEAAVRLRALPPQLQRMVMDRGPVAGTRNPSSVVISRIKEVEALRLGALPGAALLGLGAPGAHAGAAGGGGPPAPSPEIESLISRYSLDPQAASMLRRLSPEQQRLALKLPISEARNPSAFVMTQLSMPRLLGTGEASRLPTQPHDPTAMMISGLLRF